VEKQVAGIEERSQKEAGGESPFGARQGFNKPRKHTGEHVAERVMSVILEQKIPRLAKELVRMETQRW